MAGLANSVVTAFNNIGSSQASVVYAGSDSSVQVTFHNPGAVDLILAPTTQLVAGASTPLTISNPSTYGGGFRVFANGGTLTIGGQAARQAWQALAVSGSGNSLTVAVQSGLTP